MASHLYVMFPNIVAANIVWLPLNFSVITKTETTPLNRMNEGLLHALAKGLGYQFWAEEYIFGMWWKKMWTVWNYNNQSLRWKIGMKTSKSVERQLTVYITKAISRLSSLCHIRVRVSKRGQLAYTGCGSLRLCLCRVCIPQQYEI
jgi:hypothetical protein